MTRNTRRKNPRSRQKPGAGAQTLGRIRLFVVATAAVIGVGVAVADALVLTDAERLDAIVEGIVDADPGRRVDAALEHADVNREDVVLRVAGSRDHFSDGEELDLAHAMREGLRSIEERDVAFIQHAAELGAEGEAHVSVRFRSGGTNHDLTLTLSRHGDGWLTRRVQFR